MYNYYINNVAKNYDDSQRNGTAEDYNSTGTATGATRSLGLLVEEFQFTYGWYSASAGIK
jgi:hypothetical protein